MRRVKKTLVGICMVFVMCFAFVPMTVFGANISVTLGTTDNGTAGSNVTARIVLGNNPGISTFAMKLAYDNSYLTYTGATWANSVSGNTSNMQLISEVTENGRPVLNISSILNSTYSNNETIVTLNFTVRQNYTTMPVTLTNREINDSSYNPVTVNLLVDAQAGALPVSSETESESQSESESESESQSQSQTDNNSQSGGASQGGSSQGGGTSQSGSSQGGGSSQKPSQTVDHTPKTGTVDVRYVLGGIIVLFLVVAGVCVKLLGNKRAR